MLAEGTQEGMDTLTYTAMCSASCRDTPQESAKDLDQPGDVSVPEMAGRVNKQILRYATLLEIAFVKVVGTATLRGHCQTAPTHPTGLSYTATSQTEQYLKKKRFGNV